MPERKTMKIFKSIRVYQKNARKQAIRNARWHAKKICTDLKKEVKHQPNAIRTLQMYTSYERGVTGNLEHFTNLTFYDNNGKLVKLRQPGYCDGHLLNLLRENGYKVTSHQKIPYDSYELKLAVW